MSNDLNNIQVNHQIKAKHFGHNGSENQHLAVYVGNDELSFTIADDAGNTVQYMKSYRLKNAFNYFAYKMMLTDLLEQEDLFKNKYAKISIGLNAANYTLVPNKYFDLSSAEKYYDFNFSNDGNGKIMANLVEGYNCFVVFAIDFQLLDSFTEVFDQFTLQHAVSYLLPALPQPPPEEKYLYASVQKNHFDLVCLEGNRLLYCNSFACTTPADFLYHLLNVAKHSGLDAIKDNFVLLGDIAADQPAYRLCKKYLPNIAFGSRPEGKNYCAELDIIARHQHYNLYCIR